MIPPEQLRKEREKYINDIVIRNQHKHLAHAYKNGAKLLNSVEIEKLDIETAVNRLQLNNIDEHTEDVVKLAINHKQEIDYLLRKTGLLASYQFLDLYVIKILIAEILWGKQKLKIGSRETATILYYEADLKEAFIEVSTVLSNIENSYTSELPTYVRINTLSMSLEDSINAFIKEGWNLLSRPETYLDFVRIVSHLRKTDFIRDFHISELLVFPAGTSFYEHRGYMNGKFLIQDKGSCLSSFLLNPKPGSVVLDMCAAPGIKTNHLANIINNDGIIYAYDRHPDRFNRLCSLMDFTDVRCVKPIFDDCTNIKNNDVNYILVDVSSTYSGIFHKKDNSDLSTQLQYYHHLSSSILRYALQRFPNAKRVVYTTCSTFLEEGEKVVEDALKEVAGSYVLLDVKEMLWLEWMTVGNTNECSFADKCLRIKPEFDMCQSYFIAVFERNFTIPLSLYVHRVDEFCEIIYDNNSDDETAIDDQENQLQYCNQANQRQYYNRESQQQYYNQENQLQHYNQGSQLQYYNRENQHQYAYRANVNVPVHSRPFLSQINPLMPFQPGYYNS